MEEEGARGRRGRMENIGYKELAWQETRSRQKRSLAGIETGWAGRQMGSLGKSS